MVEALTIGVCDNASMTQLQEGTDLMAIRAKVTKAGLLIPRDVAERVLGEGSEVEISEESGRLIVATKSPEGQSLTGTPRKVDPILRLGKNPVRTGTRNGSANHDRYLYEGE